MKNMKSVDTYLANLYVGNVYLHNLHWNVVGPNFKAVHEYLEALYDQNFEYIDEVAELQKMYGSYPVANMKDYLSIATLKEIGKSEDIDQKTALKLATDYVKLMRETALAIRSEADEADHFMLANMMEDHIGEYDKQIWFMNSMLEK